MFDIKLIPEAVMQNTQPIDTCNLNPHYAGWLVRIKVNLQTTGAGSEYNIQQSTNNTFLGNVYFEHVF